jgi:predicted dehydrogenase
MKLLYFDTWYETPAPISFPGCATVQVLSACTPGGQADIRAEASKASILWDIFQRRRRVLKRALRYVQAIGTKRTLAKVRSNMLLYQSQLLNTVAAVAGTVAEVEGCDGLCAGSIVAGYRTGHPLYTDILLLHPEQVAEVPTGILPEDAATVFYYAMALETFKRLENDGTSSGPVTIYGDTLPSRLLGKFLSEVKREAKILLQPTSKSLSYFQAATGKGGIAIIGSQRWYKFLRGQLSKDQTYFMGLSADTLTLPEWQELKSNWIDLPHSAEHNLNIFSCLPLDLPEYLGRKGLHVALLDMSKRTWAPSSFLSSYNLSDRQPVKELDLQTAYSFRGTAPVSLDIHTVRRLPPAHKSNPLLRVGFIGLGLWARGNLIPFLLRDSRVQLVMGVDRDPIRLHQSADLFHIPIISTDPAEPCSCDEVDAVFISTWHDSHAEIASMALKARKKVFVEKPPVLSYDQLHMLVTAMRGVDKPFLAVGYNRIHSTLTEMINREISADKGPVTLTAIVREPTIPRTHYYYWPHMGSRIVGNGCHWIDYTYHLLQPRIPRDIQVVSALTENAQENNVILIRYNDGSLVTLIFSDRGESLIGGDEYIDIKFGDTQFMIQDFKTCTRYREGRLERIWQSKADRGWEQEMRDVVEGMIVGKPPRDYQRIITSAILVLEAEYSYDQRGEVRSISPDHIQRFMDPSHVNAEQSGVFSR